MFGSYYTLTARRCQHPLLAGGVWKTDDGRTYWHNISNDVCEINQPFCEQCALFFPYALFLSLPIHPVKSAVCTIGGRRVIGP